MIVPLNSESNRQAENIAYLRLNSQLARLPEAALSELAGHIRVIRFESGDRVVSRGDQMSYAGVIVKGGVRSSITSFDGHELSMSILRRGAFYGWMGISEPMLSPWDVYAHRSTELACMSATEFRQVMLRYPELLLIVARALNYRLKKAYAHMGNLVLDDLDARLRRTLFMLAGDRTKFGDQEHPSIAITQEALGHFVQCSRPTVNKLLKNLEDKGLIELGYGQITIRELDRLTPEILDDDVFLL